jgi:hypothetical protein
LAGVKRLASHRLSRHLLASRRVMYPSRAIRLLPLQPCLLHWIALVCRRYTSHNLTLTYHLGRKPTPKRHTWTSDTWLPLDRGKIGHHLTILELTDRGLLLQGRLLQLRYLLWVLYVLGIILHSLRIFCNILLLF